MLNFIFAPFTLYLIMYGYLPVVIQWGRLGGLHVFLDEHLARTDKNFFGMQSNRTCDGRRSRQNAGHLKNNRMDMQATFRKIRTITKRQF